MDAVGHHAGVLGRRQQPRIQRVHSLRDHVFSYLGEFLPATQQENELARATLR